MYPCHVKEIVNCFAEVLGPEGIEIQGDGSQTISEGVGQRERGERIGFIRFGSRVDLFIPLDWTLDCAVGDKVAGGSTVLALIDGRKKTP